MFMASKIPAKLAMINDIAGIGRCSTTVSLPIINIFGVQVCPVPTSVFSNHTGFPTYQFLDLTENMKAYFAQWESMRLAFDGIYCGFLGSMEQIEIVNGFLDSQKNYHPLIIIDPVMGDNGRAYTTVTKEHCEEMKRLVCKADMITPNLTEACLLTGTPYDECPPVKQLHTIVQKLHDLGPSRIVITGIRDNSCFSNYIFEEGKSSSIYKVPIAGDSRPGTGDIFASILVGDAMRHADFTDSVKKAADFVRICTEEAAALHIPLAEGVPFENHLHLLIPKK